MPVNHKNQSWRIGDKIKLSIGDNLPKPRDAFFTRSPSNLATTGKGFKSLFGLVLPAWADLRNNPRTCFSGLPHFAALRRTGRMKPTKAVPLGGKFARCVCLGSPFAENLCRLGGGSVSGGRLSTQGAAHQKENGKDKEFHLPKTLKGGKITLKAQFWGRTKDWVFPAGEKGASLYKQECINLVIAISEKQGWDVIYNRIRDLDFMQPGPELFNASSTINADK